MLRVGDTAAPLLRPATERDAGQIHALLERTGLPTADLGASRPEFIVACEGASVVGVGGLERFDSTGLLRSIAVSDSHRGAGVGRAIVRSLEERARELGLNELVLLTQTAKAFFEQQGYHVIARQDASPAVRMSEEFRSLCPDSAVCMLKRLRKAID